MKNGIYKTLSVQPSWNWYLKYLYADSGQCSVENGGKTGKATGSMGSSKCHPSICYTRSSIDWGYSPARVLSKGEPVPIVTSFDADPQSFPSQLELPEWLLPFAWQCNSGCGTDGNKSYEQYALYLQSIQANKRHTHKKVGGGTHNAVRKCRYIFTCHTSIMRKRKGLSVCQAVCLSLSQAIDYQSILLLALAVPIVDSIGLTYPAG